MTNPRSAQSSSIQSVEPDQALQGLRAALQRDVAHLAMAIGERNIWHYPKLLEASAYVESSLRACGLEVRRQRYHVCGQAVWNLEAEVPGGARSNEILIIGAHYDSKAGDKVVEALPDSRNSEKSGPLGRTGTPGANDNASGVAATLALAHHLAKAAMPRTLRFVFFVNEEPPFFQTPDMGSVVYARRCRERHEKVIGMMTPETLGYYTDAPGSQRYPIPFNLAGYPTTGNFLAFLSNVGSRRLLHQTVEAFKRHTSFPCLGAVVPSLLPRIGWSDDWAFWREGFQGIAITDTAYLRYPHYHTPQDTPDKLDFTRMAQAVAGLQGTVEDLANAGGPSEQGA